MKFLTKTFVALATVFAVTAAYANPTLSTSYRSDKVVDVEGVEASFQHQVDNRYTVGANLFGNKDKLVSYGAYLGIPVPTKVTLVTPYLGVEGYRPYRNITNDTVAVNLGFKTHTPVTKTVGLTTDVKWVHGTGSRNDLEDVSYSVGLYKKF